MKLAIAFTRNKPDCASIARDMLDAQKARAWHRIELLPAEGVACGVVRTSDQDCGVPLLHNSSTGNWIAVSGTPIDTSGSIETRLVRAVELDLDGATGEICQLDGAFVALIWNAAINRLRIVTDILGMQPFFLHQSNGVFLGSSEMKGIEQSGLSSSAIDPAGWGSFLSFRHMIGDRTMLASIKTRGSCNRADLRSTNRLGRNSRLLGMARRKSRHARGSNASGRTRGNISA